MLKTTVSKELAAQYPALKDKVGQTVDASVVQAAMKKGGKPESANIVSQAPKAPKKVAAKKKTAAKTKAK